MTRRTAVIVAVLLLAACTGGGPAPPGSGSPSEPVTVTLLTHDSFDVSKRVVQAFERESGTDLRIVPAGDAGQLVNRAILTAGNPEGDVLFGVDDNLLPKAVAAGVFEPYASPALERVDDAFELDDTGSVTPVDHGDVCLNVDLGWFSDRDLDPPTAIDDLVDPRYRGLTVVENPATSTPGLAFVLATIARFGDDGWQGYWRDLRANDVLVVDGWEQAYFGEFSGAGGGEGERPIVVSYATSPVAEVVFAEERLDEAPTAAVTDSCYRQVEFAGVLAGTEHPEEARQVIDFLLSRPFQEDVPLRMFVFPVADDARLPAEFARWAMEPASPLALPPGQVEAERDAWVETWTDLMFG
ncbi:MAG: thiamine ABC transporter substrate-binding protein [Actinomycetota bacterium]